MPIRGFYLINAGADFSWNSLFSASSLNAGTPADATPNCYTERTISLVEATLHSAAAPGVGKSLTLTYPLDGGTTGSSVVLSGTNTSVRGTVGGTIPPSPGFTSADSHSTKISPAGTPTVADMCICHLYQDVNDPAMTIFAWGTGATNMIYPGAPTFIGFDGASFSATENLRQAVVAATGTFTRFFARYQTNAGTTYNIECNVNGVNQYTIALPAAAATTLFTDASMTFNASAGQRVSFRINRTAGAGTNFVMYAQMLWRAS